jgi:acetyl esterase/lipase
MLRLAALVVMFFWTQKAYGQSDSIYLWHGAVPNETTPKSLPVPSTLEDGSIRVIEVTNPFLAVFMPNADRKNGRAIIICPGGAYVRLAVHKEGYTVADWLVDLGYTVFVLHYRVPDKRDGALQDLQRSIRIVKAAGYKYGIEHQKVFAMGFSAGAHVVCRAGMTGALPTYPEQDNLDKFSAKPDGMILIYPAYLSEGPNNSLSPGLKATDNTADTFIFQTMDDRLVPGAFALSTALRDASANVELHLLPEGGHGYGMDPGNKAAEAWPKLLEAWLAEHF